MRNLQREFAGPGESQIGERTCRSHCTGGGEAEKVATLLVSELATNAIRYSGDRSFGVGVKCDQDRLLVEIRDDDPRPLSRIAEFPAADQPHRRGLPLVDRSRPVGGARPTPGGKIVWFELEKLAPAS